MRLVRLAVAISLMTLAGCASSESDETVIAPTTPPIGLLGKDGRIGFSLHSNAGVTACMWGCTLMVGTDENARFDPEQPEDSVVESSDPAVAEILNVGRVTSSGVTNIDSFAIRAHAPGVVEIRIRNKAGVVTDRIDLPVDVPSHVTFSVTSKNRVKVGETIDVLPTAIDKAGKPMQASTGWTFQGDAPAIALISNACAIGCYGNQDWISVKGLTTGTVNATASAAGVSAALTVAVVP